MQILQLALKVSPIHDVIEPLRRDVAEVLDKFDPRQLAAIAEFLTAGTELLYHHTALLRAYTLSGTGQRFAKEKAS